MDDSRKGWRRGAGTGRRAGATVSGTAGKGWQSRKKDVGQSAKFRHRTRLLGIGLAAIGLVAAFVIYLLTIPGKVPLIVVGVTTYPSPIPPNGYVQEDVQSLAATNPGSLLSRDAVSQEFGRSEFLRHVEDQLKVPGFLIDRRVILVYVSAHGVVDSQGQACLLLSDSDPLNESTWLPLSQVLELLAARQGPIKVLLLDSCKLHTNWSLGILHDGFAERVAEETNKQPGIFVLTSASPGQLAWTAPELGGSIFAHFVGRGLQGAADRDGNGDVKLLELHEYVRNNVAAWARDNRASRQVPRLSPEPNPQQNVKVASAKDAAPADNGESGRRIDELANEWRTKLKGRWELYEKLLVGNTVERDNPLGLAELQQRLLRLEQLLLAGRAYVEDFSAELTDVDLLFDKLTPAPVDGKLRGFTLPLAMQFENSVEPQTERDTALAAWKLADGWPKDKEGKELPLKLNYLGAVDVAWRWLLERDAEPGLPQITEALRLVRSSAGHTDDRGKAIADVLEVHWLEMAKRHLDRPAPDADLEPATRTLLRQAWLAQKAAEEAAVPLDVRVHYWVQKLVQVADEQRRRAVDQLFVGDDASLTPASTTLATLNADSATAGSYAAARERSKQFADYYALRDQVWSRLPYLAAWFTEYRLLDNPRIVLRDSGAMQADVELATRRVGDLAIALDIASPTADLAPTNELLTNVGELQSARNRLQSDYDSFVDQLLAATADSHVLREAHLALRIPLPSASDRENLFIRKYLEAMRVPQQGATASAVEESSTDSSAAWLASWPVHPGLLFIQREPSTRPSDITDAAWLEQQGGQIRQSLTSLGEEVKRLEQESDKLLRSEATDATDRGTRRDVSRAERLGRAAAVLLGRRLWSETKDDPAYQLRRIDTHFQMLWHCRRVLEDFWGPTTTHSEQPYFADVSDKYLDFAYSLAQRPQSDAAVLRYADRDLRQLRNSRLSAVEIAIEADSIVSYGNAPPKPHRFAVNWQTEGLPPGLAAVYVTRADGDDARNAVDLLPVVDEQSKESVRRRGQDTQLASPVSVQQRLTPAAPEGASQQRLEARVYYRGHIASSPFFVRWPKFELVTSLKPSRPETASVTVSGEGNARGNIMFIVDCSGTMSENNRMQDAKAALQEVLDLLSRQGSFNVGLRGYGRRSGFARDANGRAVPDGPNGYKVVPADSKIHPDEDADDLLAELEHLTPERLGDEGDINLSVLKPLGLTPIYRALQTSLQNDFSSTSRDASRSIILITDGLNDQSGLQALGRTVRPTTAKDVLTTWQEQGRETQIYIVLIKKESSVTELRQLSTDTGGRFYDRPNSQQLAEDLRDALGLVRFSVTDPLVQDVPRDEQKELGEVVNIPGFDGRPRPFEVRLHGVDRPPRLPITLDGGEALRLNFYRRTNQLLFADFPDREPFTAVGTPQSKLHKQHKYVIKAHRPDVNQGVVNFYLSIQDETKAVDDMFEDFTPRVRQVWCEITPVSGSRSLNEQRFYFHDLDYVEHEPLPKLQFRAHGWPRDVTQADLQLWFTFDSPNLQQLQAEEVDASGARVEFTPVQGLPGIRFEASGEQLGDSKRFRLTIQEQHEDRQSRLDAAALLLSPTPEQITHTYYQGIGAAQHQYEYAQRQSVTVYVVPSADFKSRAVETRPIRIDGVE